MGLRQVTGLRVSSQRRWWGQYWKAMVIPWDQGLTQAGLEMGQEVHLLWFQLCMWPLPGQGDLKINKVVALFETFYLCFTSLFAGWGQWSLLISFFVIKPNIKPRLDWEKEELTQNHLMNIMAQWGRGAKSPEFQFSVVTTTPHWLLGRLNWCLISLTWPHRFIPAVWTFAFDGATEDICLRTQKAHNLWTSCGQEGEELRVWWPHCLVSQITRVRKLLLD